MRIAGQLWLKIVDLIVLKCPSLMGKYTISCKMNHVTSSTSIHFLEISIVALLCAIRPGQCQHVRSVANRATVLLPDDLVSCPDGTDLFTPDRTCLSRPSSHDLQSHPSAQGTCRKQGGYLATATEAQIDFISKLYAVNRDRNRTELSFWMNYIMVHQGRNSSLWNVAQEPDEAPQPGGIPTGMFPTTVPANLSDRSRVCLQLSLMYDDDGMMDTWEFRAEDCNHEMPYMCERPASSPCIDRSGNIIPEGDHYSPQRHNDPCFWCRCQGGIPTVCSSTRCSQPVCDNGDDPIPDPDECCKHNCRDSNGNIYTPNNNRNGGHTPPFNLGENTRWVLTMITSFLLLGMMLFMVYRMRQKRQAYLRYRVRRFQEAQMDFEPGSGPPAPSMEDGQFFREPPPSYQYLYLKSNTIHTDQSPPPYQSSCEGHPRRLNLASQRSDEVSLLRNSASGSMPASPASSELTSAPVFITPPESPVDTSPEGTIITAFAQSPSESATATISDAATAAAAATPMAAEPVMSSFLGNPGQRSPSRNTAV